MIPPGEFSGKDNVTVQESANSVRNRFVNYGGNGPSCAGNCDETLEYVAP